MRRTYGTIRFLTIIEKLIEGVVMKHVILQWILSDIITDITYGLK